MEINHNLMRQAKQVSAGNHALMDLGETGQRLLGQLTADTAKFSEDGDVHPIKGQRVYKHLGEAQVHLAAFLASIAMADAAGNKILEERADLPWDCDEALAERSPDLKLVG